MRAAPGSEPDGDETGVRLAILASAVLHIALFLSGPRLLDRFRPLKDLPPPPQVEIVKLDTKPPDPSAEEPPATPPAEPTPEATVTPPPEDTSQQAKAEEEGKGAEKADEGKAEADSGKSPTGEEKAPEPTGNADKPPEPVPVPTAPGKALPPLGGNAGQGEAKMQGTEAEPKVGAPEVGGPDTSPPTPMAASDIASGGGEEPLNEMIATGAEMDPSVVTVPEQGADVKVLPAAPEGAPVVDDGGVHYPWNPYMGKLSRHLIAAIVPRMPSTVPAGAANPRIHIVIERSGRVRTSRILHSSGVQEIDDAVAEALKTPLPPLPADYPKDTVGVTLEFALPR